MSKNLDKYFYLHFYVGHGIFLKSNRGDIVQDENKNKRTTMFTVRNAENAMIAFTMCGLAILMGVS